MPSDRIQVKPFFATWAIWGQDQAMEEWKAWWRKHRRSSDRPREAETQSRKALEIASGLHESAIRHYVTGRHDNLGAATLERLGNMTRALGRQPYAALEKPHKKSRRALHAPRVALLAELAVPSPLFHFEMIRAITSAASLRNLSVAVYDIPGGKFAPTLERLCALDRPDGILMLRLTPTRAELGILAKWRVPAVLLHADRQQYEPPILRNVVPDQHGMADDISEWLADCAAVQQAYLPASARGTSDATSPEVVLVAMEAEAETGDFEPMQPPTDKTGASASRCAEHPTPSRSIRNDRRAQIEKAVEGRSYAWFDLTQDYAFRRASGVLERYPNAPAYICLSDEIAIGLKMMLRARDGDNAWKHRILGFDNTQMAQDERLLSFDQSLSEAASQAVQHLYDHVVGVTPDQEDRFEEITVPVTLARRF